MCQQLARCPPHMQCIVNISKHAATAASPPPLPPIQDKQAASAIASAARAAATKAPEPEPLLEEIDFDDSTVLKYLCGREESNTSDGQPPSSAAAAAVPEEAKVVGLRVLEPDNPLAAAGLSTIYTMHFGGGGGGGGGGDGGAAVGGGTGAPPLLAAGGKGGIVALFSTRRQQQVRVVAVHSTIVVGVVDVGDVGCFFSLSRLVILGNMFYSEGEAVEVVASTAISRRREWRARFWVAPSLF